ARGLRPWHAHHRRPDGAPGGARGPGTACTALGPVAGPGRDRGPGRRHGGHPPAARPARARDDSGGSAGARRHAGPALGRPRADGGLDGARHLAGGRRPRRAGPLGTAPAGTDRAAYRRRPGPQAGPARRARDVPSHPPRHLLRGAAPPRRRPGRDRRRRGRAGARAPDRGRAMVDAPGHLPVARLRPRAVGPDAHRGVGPRRPGTARIPGAGPGPSGGGGPLPTGRAACGGRGRGQPDRDVALYARPLPPAAPQRGRIVSLILEALKKLDREKQAPDRGVVIVGPSAWPSPREGLFALRGGGLVLAAVLVGGAAGAAWLLRARHAEPPAPPAVASAPAQPAQAALPPDARPPFSATMPGKGPRAGAAPKPKARPEPTTAGTGTDVAPAPPAAATESA